MRCVCLKEAAAGRLPLGNRGALSRGDPGGVRKGLSAANHRISLDTHIASLEELSGYDAVLLATGSRETASGRMSSLLQDGVRVDGRPGLAGEGSTKPIPTCCGCRHPAAPRRPT
jgi:hypothetical protein